MFEIKNCIVDGIRCAYHDSAPQQTAQAVVFVHGTASSAGRWAELYNELDNDPRPVTIDRNTHIPSQMVLTPGSPSPFRARKPPSRATKRTTSLSMGRLLGNFCLFSM